jgi:hypothetical protein
MQMKVNQPRRRLIVAGALAPLVAVAFRGSAQATAGASNISFEKFQEGAAELAKLLPANDPAQQDAFVLLALARALEVSEFPRPKLFPMGSFAPGVRIGPIGRSGPLMLIAYEFAPGAVLPAHDHPHYAVATLGLSGEATVRHFEPVGETPPYASAASFKIRETARRLLRKGSFTTLAPCRDNIHAFTAGGAGAYFLDITSAHGADLGFSYLAVPEERQTSDEYSSRWTRIG